MKSFSLLLLLGALTHFVYGYLVTTPRKWTQDTQTQVCVVLSQGVFSTEDNLELNFDPLSKDPTILNQNISFTLPEGEEDTCINFDVPKTDGWLAEIYLEGSLGGYIINQRVNVSIERPHDTTYIQTDKYQYRPGQQVRFRILSLEGPFLKVSTEPYYEIYVQNPSRVRIQQWRNVSNPGLVHLSFQLAEEPEEGYYNIYLKTQDKKEYSTSFKIEDYVLPRFEVSVSPVGIFLGDDTQIKIKVCAKYTFGQDVEGTASLNVIIGSYRPYANITQEKMIAGCQNFTFNTTDLRFDDNNCHIRVRDVRATAKVKETGTQTELEGQATIPVYRRIIKFRDLSPKFIQRRHLPVITSVLLSYNNDSPAANELISVCTYYNSSQVCKNVTTDSAGMLNFVTPNTISNNIQLRAVNYPRLERNFNDVIEESRHSIYHHRSEKFTEAHNSSLSIYTNEKLKCTNGLNVTFTIPLIYITKDDPNDNTADFHVQVMSRGQIQFSDKRTVQLQRTTLPFDNYPFLLKEQNIPQDTIMGKHDFTVVLPNSVSPNVKIVAWFSKSDGAVIADSAHLDVTPCLNHNVGMSWSVLKGEPGSMANLKLTGEPGSLCSYGVVDKSVELLSNPSDRLSLRYLLDSVRNYGSSEWDGYRHLNLEFCLKKYNKTLDVSPQDPIEIEESTTQSSPEESSSERRKRSFPPIFGNELEAADIFRKAGFFVFSHLDLESQYCDRTINQALKDKIEKLQIKQQQQIKEQEHGFTAMKISNRRPPPAHAAPAAAFGGAAQPPPPQAMVMDHASFDDTAPEPAEEVRERTYFPETWLWELIDLTTTGEASETLTLPDTITEWVGKAVCVHSVKGVGLSDKTSLTTFTSFFIDLTLPPQAKRHEIIPVKISVFNYENHDLNVEVAMDVSNNYEFSKGEKRFRTLCIPPNSQRTEIIRIKTTSIGDVEIGVKAEVAASNKCGPTNPNYKSDKIIRSIPVEAEGFVREIVNSRYLCGEDLQGGTIPPLVIEPPANIVPDSARASINVVGDLLGPSISNLGRLLNLPYGCGEQNLIRLAPNIFVLKYLKASNTHKDIQARAEQQLRIGYQRQLTFRRHSGSFSTFGSNDEMGSTWLTAFVVKSFAQARPYIDIDENIITTAIKWLKNKQTEEGCFNQSGKVINKRMLGGVGGKSSLLTAYVLVALIEAGLNDTKTINAAVQCITSDAESETADDPYNNALKAYSLTLAGAQVASQRVADLRNSATETDRIIRWDIPDTRNRALEVETAGYGLLALLESDPATHINAGRKISRYLTGNRNHLGGFVSTQDTVVALQALAEFETHRPSGNLNLAITVQNDELNREFLIDENNKLLQQTEKVPTIPSSIQLGMSGTGCALIQSVLRYNIQTENKDSAFNINLAVTPVQGDCASRNMKICTNYTLPDGKSNMAVLEINLLTGYVAERADLAQVVRDSPSVKRYEYDHGRVTFYLDDVTSEEICVNLNVHRDIDVDNIQERYIKVYDYYQPEYTSEQKYNFDLASCNVA